MRLSFSVPDDNTPGFLKRTIEALEFQRQLSEGATPDAMRAMAQYLTQFVTEPERQEDKLEAILMASKVEFMQLFQALSGGDANPT